MSVIPLVHDGRSPTVTTVRERFDIDGTRILFVDLDETQLADPKRSNATYDLRVGDTFWDHQDFAPRSLRQGERIRLPAGRAIIVRTMEWVGLPKAAFGAIFPRVKLLQEGLSNTSSKVDPGYQGNLLITVFNLGRKTVHLAYGQPFCAVCFYLAVALYALTLRGAH